MTSKYFNFVFVEWRINPSPHRILGDDQDGPHSSAIIIGRKTVIGCAHSLGLLIDDTQSNTKKTKETKKLRQFKYLEDYWIQPYFTRTLTGEFTADNRIPLKLCKFNVDNDWALFVRADGGLFAPDEIASIDTSPVDDPHKVLVHKQAIIYHCPVSLKSAITKVDEFTINSQLASVHIQGKSTHHVKYEGRDLCRGSSGGGVYVSGSPSVLGMHIEPINDAEFDAADEEREDIAFSDKQVRSEDDPYPLVQISSPPPTKKLKSESDTIASLAGGNNGLGSAIIICKFPRLMYYISEIE